MSKKVVYEIDSTNKIISLGEGWNEAAKEGGAQKELGEEEVVGSYLQSHVASDPTKMYYDAVFKLCRIKNEPLEREYRCDSPTHKRFMKMTLYPLENNIIRS